MKIIMNIQTHDPSDCIFGMRAVKALSAHSDKSIMGLLFDNDLEAVAKRIKSGYSVCVSKVG